MIQYARNLQGDIKKRIVTVRAPNHAVKIVNKALTNTELIQLIAHTTVKQLK